MKSIVVLVKNLFNKLVNIGVNQNLTKTKIKRIKILNFSAFFMGFNALFPTLIKYFLAKPLHQYEYIFTIEGVLYFFVLMLNYKKKYFYARLLFLVLFTSILFLHNNFFVPGEYSEYYYIVIPIASLLFFDKNYIHYIFLTLAILLFYLPNYYLEIYPKERFGFFHVAPFFIGIFLGVFYFRNENIKNEKSLEEAYQKLEEQKKNELANLHLKALKAQMNPHFMFNAMNSIQNLILKDDKIEAYEYLTKFSLLIRENLNMSEKSFVLFDEELSLLEKYLQLEKLRFRDNFQYSILGADSIQEIKIPSMIIQPFVENAIKHGLLHKVNGTRKLLIEFDKTDILQCTITDNGIGFEASKNINRKNGQTTSFSTKSIKQKLQFLEDYYKMNIGFSYENVDEGTKVIIKIPYKE